MPDLDKYFQIALRFRDEDARADRSPGEFYQLDIEMSFVTQDDVFNAIEPVLQGVFEEFADGRSVSPAPFPRITFADAMQKYGSDKPDLRNPIEMSDITDTFRGSGFKIFAGMIENDENVRVWAIPAPGGGSRAFCDRMNSWAQKEGQPGLGYIFYRDGEGAGPVAKNIGEDRTEALRPSWGSVMAMPCFSLLACRRTLHTLPVKRVPRSAMRLNWWMRTSSSSAGSWTTRCTNWMKTPARSSSAITRSQCHKVDWKRWKPRIPSIS